MPSDSNDQRSLQLTRRDTIKLAAGAALATAIPGTVAAQDASPTPEGMSSSPMAGVPNAYWIYPEPFTTVPTPPGKGGNVSFLYWSDLSVKGRDDSQYWQELERRLGVTFDVTFVPGANYAEKMATTFAGGEFPDLMHVATLVYPQISEFMLQGAFLDVTSYLDGDARQAFPNLNAFPAYAFENSKLNGKLYGVPSPTSSQPNGLWYRADWLDKLGASAPANAAEFLSMIDRFAKEDPDGNGSADTYGSSFDTVNPFETRFVHAMFRVPAEGDGFGFTLNADGTFTNEIETPEFRAAMEWMREMWATDACHPDSLTQTSNDIREQFMGGQVGEISNAYILLGLMRTELAKVVPDGEILGLVPPGFDGGDPVTYNIAGYFGQHCIPTANGADEARVEELVGISNYLAAPFGSEEYTFLTYGIEGVHHTVNDDGSRTLTEQGTAEVFNPSLGGLNILYHPSKEHITYVQSLMAEQTQYGVTDPTFNLYSETAAAKKGELQQLYFDTKIAIGSGREPMTALDEWIADWRSRGGEQILQEYAEAYEQANS